MIARMIAKAVLAAIAVAMAFFGIGFLGMALATALAKAIGAAAGYGLAGLVLLLPPLIWAVVTFSSRPKKQPLAGNNELIRIVLASLAKETPWIAVIGASLASVVNMFLNRNKSTK